MWKHLYDWIIELITGIRWSAFLAGADDDLTSKFRDIFRNDLYPLAGYILLFGTLSGVLIYYFLMNRKGGSGYYFKRKYWLYMMLATSLLICILSFFLAQTKTKIYGAVHPFRFVAALAVANLLYAAALFALLSFLFKRFSIANTTPF